MRLSAYIFDGSLSAARLSAEQLNMPVDSEQIAGTFDPHMYSVGSAKTALRDDMLEAVWGLAVGLVSVKIKTMKSPYIWGNVSIFKQDTYLPTSNLQQQPSRKKCKHDIDSTKMK